MNVAISGQEGYDYQYEVSAYLILLFIDIPGFTARVEEPRTEDLTLRFQAGGQEHVVEVQSKREAGKLDVLKLASWLAHFPDRSAAGCLLERMDGDSHRFVIFTTRARCTDAVQALAWDGVAPIPGAPLQPIGRVAAAELLRAFGTYPVRDTTQSKDRRGRQCKQIGTTMALDRVRELTRRIAIWEQLSELRLSEHLEQLLTTRFRVPRQKCRDVVELIVREIKTARGKDVDPTPAILRHVDKYRREHRFQVHAPVPRPEAEALEPHLRATRCLLLTGAMQCGKTAIAHGIARMWQTQGVGCERGDDPDEAARYFAHESSECLFVLEDPLGSQSLKDDAPRRWEQIQRLVEDLRHNHHLIITCRDNVLESYLRAPDRETRQIGAHRWHDLTVRDRAIAGAIWEERCRSLCVPWGAAILVRKGLDGQPDAELLQPGQLDWLARRCVANARPADFDDACRIARQRAQEIGENIRSTHPELERPLAALSIGATTTTPLSERELAWILSDSNERPGLLRVERWKKLAPNARPALRAFTDDFRLGSLAEECPGEKLRSASGVGWLAQEGRHDHQECGETGERAP